MCKEANLNPETILSHFNPKDFIPIKEEID